MKKKVLSALLTTAMLASMLVGCGAATMLLQQLPVRQHPQHPPKQQLLPR